MISCVVPYIWALGQVCWSWVALGTDIASTISLFGAAKDPEAIYDLENPNFEKEYTSDECDDRLDAYFGKNSRSWGAVALLLMILSPLAQAIIAWCLHKDKGKQWKGALRSILQLDEIYEVVASRPTGTRTTRVLLATNDVVQTIFGNLQALLSLYVVLEYISNSDYTVKGCGWGTSTEIVTTMPLQFLKVAAAIIGSSHGLAFVAAYTKFSLLSIVRVPGWQVPTGWRAYMVDWLMYDLPFTVCMCCSVATHIMVYAVFGTWRGGWVVFVLLVVKFVWNLGLGAAREAGWSWHLLWQAAVSTTVTMPWGTWQFDDCGDDSSPKSLPDAKTMTKSGGNDQPPATTHSEAPPARAWWIFIITIILDFLLALVVGTCIIDEKIIKYDKDWSLDDYDWPQKHKETGWALTGLVLVQPPLWAAVSWWAWRRAEVQAAIVRDTISAPRGPPASESTAGVAAPVSVCHVRVDVKEMGK